MSYQADLGMHPVKWPFEISYDKVNHVTVDTVIIGGGLAGCCAGIAAARGGVKVAVIDKAPIKRSGCGGAGMDHWNTVLDYEGSPMTVEENFRRGSTDGRQGHRDYIAVKGTWNALMELKKLGLQIEDEDGDFFGTATYDKKTKLLKAYDYRELVAVKLRGGQFIKPVLYDGLRKEKNVSLFERVMATSLFTENGKQGTKVTGVAGFSMETGELYIFHTKSVILTSGYACTIWTYSTEITGNSWRWDPNEIGEGLAMAWNAGAEIFGMYKNGHTRASHPFAWPRFGVGNPNNTWFPCTIVDNNGKEIPWMDKNGKVLTSVKERNLPAEDQPYCGSTISDDLKSVATPNLIKDLPDRIKNGEYELPLWADLPGMPEEERKSIWGVMVGNEGKSRFTLYDYYTRAGFNPELDMLMAPIMQPEGYRSGGWFQGEPNAAKPWRSESFGRQGEPLLDWNLMTTVPGLFAAGAASGLEGCSFACSSGFFAGNRASEYAKANTLGEIDKKQLEKEQKRIYAPIKRMGKDSAYISWKELWGGSARVMQQCCADFKTESILKQGLMWLESIKKTEMQETYARNPHELARVLEDETRITVSEMFLNGCLTKLTAEKENMPEKSYLFIRKDGNRVKTKIRSEKFWLQAPYQEDYLKNYLKHAPEYKGGCEK